MSLRNTLHFIEFFHAYEIMRPEITTVCFLHIFQKLLSDMTENIETFSVHVKRSGMKKPFIFARLVLLKVKYMINQKK